MQNIELSNHKFTVSVLSKKKTFSLAFLRPFIAGETTVGLPFSPVVPIMRWQLLSLALISAEMAPLGWLQVMLTQPNIIKYCKHWSNIGGYWLGRYWDGWIGWRKQTHHHCRYEAGGELPNASAYYASNHHIHKRVFSWKFKMFKLNHREIIVKWLACHLIRTSKTCNL